MAPIRAFYVLGSTFVLTTPTLSVRREAAISLLSAAEHSAVSGDECSALFASIDQLAVAFDCVRERCGGGGGEELGPPPMPPSGGGGGTSPTAPTEEMAPVVEGGEDKGPQMPSAQVQVGTYIPNWFVYKKHYMGINKLGVNDVTVGSDPEQKYTYWAHDLVKLAPMLTHLYYSFWDLDSECEVVDPDPDASWYGVWKEPSWIQVPSGACKGLMNDMMGLKAQFPHLKLLVSLGGWTYSSHFSRCAATAQGREKIWKSADFWMRQMDANWGKSNAIWDGIDFDWEFPEAAGLTEDFQEGDWENFVELVDLFRAHTKAAGRTHALLTAAVGVGPTVSKLATRPSTTKAFCESLNHFNLMTYDIHGKWEPTTGHNAPFCQDPRPNNPSMPVSIQGVINLLMDAGCPTNKMMLGIPNYAPAWTGIEPGPLGNGLFVESSNKALWAGWSTFSDNDVKYIPQGLITYWDLLDQWSSAGLEKFQYNCPAELGVVVPIKHAYSRSKKVFASMDDEDVAKKKVEWAKKKGLGGFFFWDAQQDKNGALLKAARDGWGGLPTHSSSGSYVCSSKKPNYKLDPFTGAERPLRCELKGKHVVATGAVNSCATAKAAANAKCGEAGAIFRGSERSWAAGKCYNACSENWGPSKDDLMAEDKIFYACRGEEEEETGAASGSATGGGGAAGGCPSGGCPSCQSASCKTCKATQKGLSNVVVSDAKCQTDCITNKEKYWPCSDVSASQLCYCAS